MSFQEWSLVVGVVVSCGMAFGPWMFMVHAKLAVIATQASDLCDKLERASEANRKLWALCARHEARLESHEVQIANLCDRLKDVWDQGRDRRNS